MGNKQVTKKPTLLHTDLFSYLCDAFTLVPDNITFNTDALTKQTFKGIADEFNRINNNLFIIAGSN